MCPGFKSRETHDFFFFFMSFFFMSFFVIIITVQICKFNITVSTQFLLVKGNSLNDFILAFTDFPLLRVLNPVWRKTRNKMSVLGSPETIHMSRMRNELTDTVNSLPKSRRQNFRLQIFKKMLSPSYIILRIQRLEGKQCRF